MAAPGQVAALGANVVDVATGGQHACARKGDGTLWCWGINNDGQLGDGTTVDKYEPVQVTALGTGVAEVTAGHSHACARKNDGTIWCWGRGGDGELGDGKIDSPEPSPVQVRLTCP
jgi:alpha-tubulin suppressor-like RCC1 family protein